MLSDSGSVHRLYFCLQCLHCFRPSDKQICERCKGSKVCDHFVLEEQKVKHDPALPFWVMLRIRSVFREGIHSKSFNSFKRPAIGVKPMGVSALFPFR